jgi:UTP-glucose-1-phosphate uridylyltransferase
MGWGSEIQLTDGIGALMQGEQVLDYRYSGKHYDCGSKIDYLEATLVMARKHPKGGLQFEQLLAACSTDSQCIGWGGYFKKDSCRRLLSKR